MPVTITPLGAARNVTGSRHLIECDGLRLLVDCGLYQERDFLARNWEEFPVPPRSIHAVLLTHAHIDHCGFLPRLVKDGFRGRIYTTAATAEIVPIILADAARLQEEDAETKRRRHAEEGRRGGAHGQAQPLYEERDVPPAVRLLHVVDFAARTQVAPGVFVTWMPAGHILGAAILLVEIGGKRIVFSGDLGRPDRPMVPDPTPPPACDALVVESTYGDRLHASDADIPGQLADIVGATVERGGKILIPTFAVERAQELLWHLEQLHHEDRLPSVPVFLDSPMAVDLLAVYARHPEALDAETNARFAGTRSPFRFDGLTLCRSREDSKAINVHRGPAIIIAGSGMCNGGRIKHHLNQWIDDPASAMLFVGYQAQGTLGRLLVQGASQVRLFGRDRRVRLRVAQVQGFSGHADRDENLAWLSSAAAKPGRIIVIHGGEQVAPAFAQLVTERLGVPAHAPVYRESVPI